MISSKKGFTLIEVTIVLTVLLVVFSITIRGKGLVEQARLRSDFGKIRTIKQAIAVYIAENPRLASGVIRYQNDRCPQRTFFNEIKNKIDKNNLYIATIASSINLTNTAIMKTSSHDGKKVKFAYSQSNAQSDCLTGVTDFVSLQSISFVTPTSNRSFGCKIDAIFDDSNQSSGEVLGYLPSYSGDNVPASIHTTEIRFPACADVDNIADYAILLYYF